MKQTFKYYTKQDCINYVRSMQWTYRKALNAYRAKDRVTFTSCYKLIKNTLSKDAKTVALKTGGNAEVNQWLALEKAYRELRKPVNSTLHEDMYLDLQKSWKVLAKPLAEVSETP